jgi:hypothetical protein
LLLLALQHAEPTQIIPRQSEKRLSTDHVPE